MSCVVSLLAFVRLQDHNRWVLTVLNSPIYELLTYNLSDSCCCKSQNPSPIFSMKSETS